MLNELIDRSKTHINAATIPDAPLLYGQTCLNLYEKLQTEHYLPVEPHQYLRRIIPGKHLNILKEDSWGRSSPTSATTILLNFFLNKDAPAPHIFQKTCLNEKAFEQYPILISSMVFHTKSSALTDLFLEYLMLRSSIDASLPVLDYAVMALFFMLREDTHLSRTEMAARFHHSYFQLSARFEKGVTKSRYAAYQALDHAIRNEPNQAYMALIEAQTDDHTYCTPLMPVYNFSMASPANAPQTAYIDPTGLYHKSADTCLITACDKAYFEKYFESFCQKSTLDKQLIHLHCIDFSPQQEALEKLELQYNIRINHSCEFSDLTFKGDTFGTWCATARYRILPELLQQFPKCAIIDIDGYIEPCFSQIAAQNQAGIYAHIADTSDNRDIRLPWNMIYAGNCLLIRDHKTMQFARHVAFSCTDILIKRIQNRQKTHYFDQAALLSASIATDADVIPIPMFFRQKETSQTSFTKERPPA